MSESGFVKYAPSEFAVLVLKKFYQRQLPDLKEEEFVMRIKATILCSLVASLGLANLGMAAEGAAAPAVTAAPAPVQMTGQQLAFDKNKGNCLSCHVINDPKADSPGDLGPTLEGIKERYPEREKLRAQIWDATVLNPDTAMPPMGRNKILSEQEIDLVVDYLLSL